MGRRLGKLPGVCSVELGPVIQRNASDNLQPNTRILGCIADNVKKQKRIAFLEKKVQTKDEVLAELMAEHIALKKSLGEL